MLQVVLYGILVIAEIPFSKLVHVEPVITSKQVLHYLVILRPVPAEVVPQRAFDRRTEILGRLRIEIEVILVRTPLLQNIFRTGHTSRIADGRIVLNILV